MRFLHVIQRYFPFEGGSERYFRSVSEQFVAHGADVQVISTDAWDLEHFWDPTRARIERAPGSYNGVKIQRLPVAHLPLANLTHRAIRRVMAESSRVRFPAQLRLLEAGSQFGPWLPLLPDALRRAGDIDLMHSANIAFESMITASAEFARERGVPHVVTPFLHLGESRDSKVRRYYTMPHQLRLLRSADAVMALTSIEADYLLREGVREDRLFVVGAGIDRQRVTGGEGLSARQRLGIDGPMVLTLGAAAFDKGTIHLVQAVSSLNRARWPVDLVVAGPVLGQFSSFMSELSDQDRRHVHALGFVPDDEKRDLLAAADMVALPSRTESFGLVFLEAWANGKPVIGARAGAIPAVVDDGVDGLLVEFGDVEALAAAIQSLANNATLRDRMATAGARKVVSERAWFARVQAVYEHVMGKPISVPETAMPSHEIEDVWT